MKLKNKILNRQAILFAPLLVLTMLTTVPLINLIRGGLVFESSQKTKLTGFLVVPGVPVFSTDDFFEYVYFKGRTSSGKTIDIGWQQLIRPEYQNNFLFYVYMRHIFNTRKNGRRTKAPIINWAMKEWICQHPEKFNLAPGESLLSAEYFVSYPLEAGKVKEHLRVSCHD